ncbi:MAG: hypothetical protein H0V18_08210 [Pyrinomonadaceae bacterium]|nr:hypothetical protein [Pyrinomonadaceae bacterium]
MKAFFSCSIVAICLVLALAQGAPAQGTQNEAPLNNAAIVKLARAGFKEKTIISIIAARAPRFDLSADRMIELKRSGVSEKVIVAMLARQEGMELLDDSWSDDAVLDKDLSTKAGSPGTYKSPEGGSTNIFGSSGGVRGSTRSRGGNGSVSGETETTGSATVRIIRPPAEAGSQPKLDKTPSLTNDSIIELVEAGFSEGTIVRRIEQSPVEFNLAPEKLGELRKHRVSDKILAAMKIATGEDSSPTKNPPRSDVTPKE